MAARYGYRFGVDVVTVLAERDPFLRKLRMAALEVHALDHQPRGTPTQ